MRAALLPQKVKSCSLTLTHPIRFSFYWKRSIYLLTLSLYAVLDHSFDPKLIQKLKNQITWVSLYQDQGNPEHEICPLLCLIDTETPTALHSQLALLLQVSEGWPMLSFSAIELG